MTQTQSPIGFIGLGLLGSAMARRLASQGHTVVGYDIVPEKMAALQQAGVQPADSAADVAQRCALIEICVMTTEEVQQVARGEDGILTGLDGITPTEQRIIVDHSTTRIDETLELSATVDQQAGAAWIDAPVSGGPGAADNGTLSIMAGGQATAIEKVRPVIEKLGAFTHMGDTGAGQATKLVNQTLVLPAYCIIAEALRLAQAYGVDASKIPGALASGHAGSNLLPVLFERMIAEDFTPTGYARQVLKDLEMLHSASKEAHLPMPMTSQALNQFRSLVAQGKGDLDGSAVVTLLPRAGTERG